MMEPNMIADRLTAHTPGRVPPLRRWAAVPLLAAVTLGLSACGVLGGGDNPRTTPTVGKREPILSRIESGAQLDPALANLAVVLPLPAVNAEWAQPGGTASKSYGHPMLSQQPVSQWTVSIAGSSPRRRLAASPVVGNGTLFAVDSDANVHAFDAQTGAKRWTQQLSLEKDLAPSSFGGGASFAAGRLYVTDGAGQVAALDAATGAELWKVKPAGPLRGSPTIAFNTVFVMTQNNQIIALSTQDGSLIWQEASSLGQTGLFGVASPAAGQGTVIAGFSTGEVTAYRFENGRNVWSDALARTSISTEVGVLTDVDADPIIDSGRVYALGQGGRMAAYELLTGQRIWELSLAGISTPAVAGEWIFTLTSEAKLLAIARSSGKVRWITELQRYRDMEDRKNEIFWTGPALANNRLYVANSRGALFQIDVMTGEAREYADLGSSVSLPPIVAGQMLYVLDDSGKIHAFR
jgi:outer membrane protein assembly factor BamB